MSRLAHMLITISVFAAVRPCCLRAQGTPDTAFAASWTPIRVIASSSDASGGDSLIFRNGVRFQTGLYGVRLLGLLPAGQKAPYLVLEGVGCFACDGSDELDIQSPTDGRVSYPTRVGYFTPGPHYRPPPDTQAVLQVRAFIGRCLPTIADGIVWFVARREGAEWRAMGVHVVHVVQDHLRALDLAPPLPSLRAVVPQVRAGACRELSG